MMLIFFYIGMILGIIHILISGVRRDPLCPPCELKDIIYDIKPEAYPYKGNK